MIRKGRFDQLFFVDLPGKKDRIEILRIHFLNQGINPYQFDIDNIAKLMHEWTAAEIAQLVKSAQIDAFTQNRKLTYEDIIQNLYTIVLVSCRSVCRTWYPCPSCLESVSVYRWFYFPGVIFRIKIYRVRLSVPCSPYTGCFVPTCILL